MITEDSVEQAVDYLRSNATKAAQARANRIYLDEYRKVIKATIMRQHQTESLGAQEAIAYSDPQYAEHLKAMQDAIQRDEYHRWMMVAAEAKISAWQTQSRNQRVNV
jgi:chromosome segregation ATPase